MQKSPIITPQQRERLEEVFGKNGAGVILSHLGNLEEMFGTGALVIRRVMDVSPAFRNRNTEICEL